MRHCASTAHHLKWWLISKEIITYIHTKVIFWDYEWAWFLNGVLDCEWKEHTWCILQWDFCQYPKKLHTISVLSCELGLVSTSTAITLLIYLHIGYFSILACNKLLKHLLTKSWTEPVLQNEKVHNTPSFPVTEVSVSWEEIRRGNARGHQMTFHGPKGGRDVMLNPFSLLSSNNPTRKNCKSLLHIREHTVFQ